MSSCLGDRSDIEVYNVYVCAGKWGEAGVGIWNALHDHGIWSVFELAGKWKSRFSMWSQFRARTKEISVTQ